MKKKIISIVIASTLAFGATTLKAEVLMGDLPNENKSGTNLNYTSIGVGAASGALIAGPVGLIIGGVAGGLFGGGYDEKPSDNYVDENTDINTEVVADTNADTDVNPELVVISSADEMPVSMMVANADNDIAFADNSSPDERSRVQEIIKNDLTVPVYFKAGSVSVEDFYMQQFSTITSLLQAMPDLILNLDGYSDRQGKQSDNLQLSEKRLESVRDYFIKHGIDINRIHIQAYGEKNFLSTAGELDSYMFDRRVVVSFKSVEKKSMSDLASVSKPASM